MKISEAIGVTQGIIAQRKIKLQKEKEHQKEFKHLQVNKEVALKARGKELLQKLHEKARVINWYFLLSAVLTFILILVNTFVQFSLTLRAIYGLMLGTCISFVFCYNLREIYFGQ